MDEAQFNARWQRALTSTQETIAREEAVRRADEERERQLAAAIELAGQLISAGVQRFLAEVWQTHAETLRREMRGPVHSIAIGADLTLHVGAQSAQWTSQVPGGIFTVRHTGYWLFSARSEGEQGTNYSPAYGFRDDGQPVCEKYVFHRGGKGDPSIPEELADAILLDLVSIILRPW